MIKYFHAMCLIDLPTTTFLPDSTRLSETSSHPSPETSPGSETSKTTAQPVQTAAISRQTVTESSQTAKELNQNVTESVQSDRESSQAVTDLGQNVTELGQTATKSGQIVIGSSQATTDSSQSGTELGFTEVVQFSTELIQTEPSSSRITGYTGGKSTVSVVTNVNTPDTSGTRFSSLSSVTADFGAAPVMTTPLPAPAAPPEPLMSNVSCPSPPEVTNAWVELHGGVAEVECNIGYQFPDGSQRRSLVCLSDGSWSAESLACQGKV